MNSSNNSNKLWAGVSSGEISSLLGEFNNSLEFDFALWQYDIQGSLAHSKMLAKQDIITQEDYKLIKQGLEEIQSEISSKPQEWLAKNIEAEDIHSAIEMNLTARIGDAGKRLHTGRSRNDQVATDLRLYLIQNINIISELLDNLRQAFVSLAERDINQVIPGYTHLQQAQPVSLGHHWLAHYERFTRDSERLADCLKRVKVCPLGAGALAGTTYNLDREFTSSELGFDSVSHNSLDSVSDRDYVAEFLFVMSMVGIHLSQLSEEIIIWASQEFSFIKLHPDYATGSSMMPQKRNPDIPELLRGKSGRLIGHLNALLITLKALPLAYNKDLQEDKEGLFDCIKQINIMLKITTEFLPSIQVNTEKLNIVISQGFLNATDLADYLVTKGLPFREAYKIVGQAVRDCLENNTVLKNITLETWKEKYSELIEEDIYEKIDEVYCMNRRNTYGGGSPEQVLLQLQRIK